MLTMDSVMMKPIMQNATMMVVTVAGIVSTLNIVQNVFVMREGNQHMTLSVSDLFMMTKESRYKSYTIIVNIGCESDIPNDVGDWYCDDQNNNEGCLFDGGDCCGPSVDTTYCSQCQCLN